MLRSNRTAGWGGGVPLLLTIAYGLGGLGALRASLAQTTQAGTSDSVAAGRVNAPASLQEAAAVIDFRTFPGLERDEVVQQSATKIAYTLAKPDLSKDMQFYRDKLTAAGWKIEYDKVDPKISFGTLRCAKQGFVVDVTIFQNPGNKKMQVSLENQGNVDARAIPRPAGADVTQAQSNVTIFRIGAKPAEVARFLRTELKGLGWREAVNPDMPVDDEQDDYCYVNFIQRGARIGANMQVKDGKTEVMYQAELLQVGLPIMPDAKGRIEHCEAPYLHLGYATPSQPNAVLAFYRKELAALGWSLRAGTEKIENGKAKVLFDGADKKALRLELLSQGGPTLVLISDRPEGR